MRKWKIKERPIYVNDVQTKNTHMVEKPIHLSLRSKYKILQKSEIHYNYYSHSYILFLRSINKLKFSIKN